MPVDPTEAVLAELVRWPETGVVDRRGVAVGDLIAAARRHRMIGILGAASDDGALGLDEAETASVRAEVVRALTEVVLVEDAMLGAVAVLTGARVDHRVLKGSALAHTVHPDAAHRTFGDTDLLVRVDDIDRAVETLVEAGGRRRHPPLTVDFDRRFAKSVTMDWLMGTELDVHRTLAPGPFGLRVVLDDLWATSARFTVAGVEVATLDREHHLLHALYHLVLGDVTPRFGTMRDVVVLLGAGVDEDVVVNRAERWRGGVVLAEADRLVTEVGGNLGAIGTWASALPASRRDRAYLAAHRRRRGRARRQLLASLAEVKGRDRLDLAAAAFGHLIRSTRSRSRP